MKVTFKDVGQGDSILLEWTDEGTEKIGIIDCNIKDKKNPVVEYIRKKSFEKIEFIILSHPHSDHFSGMVELLNYLEEINVSVGFFGHTLHFFGTEYYRYLEGMESTPETKSALKNLFIKVDVLKTKSLIKKIAFVLENWQIELVKGITMKCLSPCISEAKKFMTLVDLEPIKNKTAASGGANYLSTIFKITAGNRYYLLTSDSEVLTFKRIVEENIHQDLQKEEMQNTQLPHHGALKNYYPLFWDFITKNSKPEAFVSAGLHETYRHPHLPVLMAFHEQGYTVHSTNIVYGMIEYMDYLEKISTVSRQLDSFTELISSHTGGDKSFVISE